MYNVLLLQSRMLASLVGKGRFRTNQGRLLEGVERV